jgi:hypothetical protein
MPRPSEPVARATSAAGADRPRLYWLLFGMQTLGALVLYGNGIPLYRRVYFEPGTHQAELAGLLWSVPAIALMQAAYWIDFRLRPPLPRFVQPVLGHIVLCAGRFGFIFATGVFTFLFLLPRAELTVPPGRYVVALFGLFSLYCYTLEVDRFGRAMVGRATEK